MSSKTWRFTRKAARFCKEVGLESNNLISVFLSVGTDQGY